MSIREPSTRANHIKRHVARIILSISALLLKIYMSHVDLKKNPRAKSSSCALRQIQHNRAPPKLTNHKHNSLTVLLTSMNDSRFSTTRVFSKMEAWALSSIFLTLPKSMLSKQTYAPSSILNVCDNWQHYEAHS